MDDLIEFLRARLDEDDLTVREANTSPEMVTGIPRSYAEAPVAIHIARFANPDRVLAEIEAKREVLHIFERTRDYSPIFMSGIGAAMVGTLRLLAQAYDGHPDYREDWRP
ncbi:DUF6221 family protein [Streptomyces sp. CA-111067]|uniref:DUF6221 family protein n=1 Tax=Streptomyces sp. CA-111067 TaxID=3240046 RepID=UPI003D99D541